MENSGEKGVDQKQRIFVKRKTARAARTKNCALDAPRPEDPKGLGLVKKEVKIGQRLILGTMAESKVHER